VGWIACLRLFGDLFQIQGFYVMHLTMVVLMCITWVVLFILTMIAFYKGAIFRSKEEDVWKDAPLHSDQGKSSGPSMV